MLRKRLIASFLMICPVLAVFWLDTQRNGGVPGSWSVPVIMLFSVVIAGEFLAMTRERTAGAAAWVLYLGTVLCQLAVVLPELGISNLASPAAVAMSSPEAVNTAVGNTAVGSTAPGDSPFGRWGWSTAAVILTLFGAFLHELLTFTTERKATSRVGLTMLGVLYSGWLLSFLSAMRIEMANYKGAIALFSVLFIIKMSDAGAYFVGKHFGQRKLAPVLSPKKTVEGLFGGIAAALLAAFIVFGLIMPNFDSPPHWLAATGYAITISLVGVFGDLCESMIKRDMGCKDSSGWLPGLGGIMDTADSVVLAAPLAYLWWRSGIL